MCGLELIARRKAGGFHAQHAFGVPPPDPTKGGRPYNPFIDGVWGSALAF